MCKTHVLHPSVWIRTQRTVQSLWMPSVFLCNAKLLSLFKAAARDDSRRKTPLVCHAQLCEWRRRRIADHTLAIQASKNRLSTTPHLPTAVGYVADRLCMGAAGQVETAHTLLSVWCFSFTSWRVEKYFGGCFGCMLQMDGWMTINQFGILMGIFSIHSWFLWFLYFLANTIFFRTLF